MNSIQLYSNEVFSLRTTQDADGTVWFVAKDIAEGLEYSLDGGMGRIFGHVPDCWKGGKRIATVERGEQEMLCVTEQGLYFFLGRSDKPKALPYQMWIANDVVPSIMHTGSYSLNTNNEDLTLKMKGLDLEGAKLLQRMIDAPAVPLSDESKAVIQHEVFKLVTGHECLSMLPEVTDKYYSATELGKMFGVSSKKIGKIAKNYGLKSEEGKPSEYGHWILSKSPYSCHQCTTFTYNGNAVDWFTEHTELLV